MSLNWKASPTTHPDLLRVRWRYKGKETEDMHPMLHRLIFLTMALGADYTKKREDVLKRIKLLRAVDADLVTLNYGDEAEQVEFYSAGEWVPFLKYYPTAVKTEDGYSVTIDANWVDRYWGLSTNADRLPFSKFSKRMVERATK